MNITPTDKQNKCINAVYEWYNNSYKQEFVLAGYPGTGKTTLLKFIIEKLKIPKENVVIAAYTGMAASVLIRKGNKNVSTIHKLIYDSIPIIDKLTGVTTFYNKLKESLDSNVDLIVIDEKSMVSDDLMEQILSFNKKVFSMGDPDQLTPIYGKCSGLDKPDFLLDEILRQALENPIIYIAKMIREREVIKYGNYGDNTKIINNKQITNRILKDSDQILAGKNITIKLLNKYFRSEILKIADPFPIKGDKLICLKNDWNHVIMGEENLEISIVNGLIGYIDSEISNNTKSQTYNFDFKPSFVEDNSFKKLYVDKFHFLNEKMKDSFNQKALYLFRKNLINSYGIQEFQFGNVITVHKSQGSQFNNIVIFNEVLNRNNHYKWLNTAVTRAENGLVLVI